MNCEENSKRDLIGVIEFAFVLVVSSAMMIYGAAKYFQFGGDWPAEKTLGELSGMELMWAFYGYSTTYVVLLGVAEMLGGWLLLIRRTRVLGALLISAILANVIVQDIVYEVNQGALVAAIIYQLMTLSILGIHRDALRKGLQALCVRNTNQSFVRRVWLSLAAIVLACGLKYVEYQLTH